MQLLITHGSMARTRTLQFQVWQLLLLLSLLVVLLMAASGAIYHFVFLKAAREGWPVVSPLVRLIVRDEIAQKDRFMRDNLDAMAQKLGELQAKLVKLEAMGERVAGLVSVKVDELKPLLRNKDSAASGAESDKGRSGGKAIDGGKAGNGDKGGKGGPYLPLHAPLLDELNAAVAELDEAMDFNTDLYTLFESRLLENRLTALMIPSAPPLDTPATSGFGFRIDPFTGRAALHTGLDFPAEDGVPIRAAAGGVVVARETHPAYGLLLELDHGNGLSTRYGHCSSIEVSVGSVVRRGQQVARVGSTGRSTGSHLHFEVLVDGVPQDPARFLALAAPPLPDFAERPRRR